MEELNISAVFFGFFGGLGLFLYGMKLMSESLQKTAGSSLKSFIDKVTSNRFIGVFIGMAVTVIIQSSSATTVMVVGFVNAKLMNLVQALTIVLGANIGTTVTAQLIAFKITKFALPAIGFGVMIAVFSKSIKKRHYGEIILGFGLLFFGLTLMKEAFLPLRNSAGFSDLFIYFSANPIAAAGAGAVLTMVVQSSSATMGIVIAMASTGLLSFPAAAALVLGENIGTTFTANLSALGAGRAAKRAAFGHFLFNLIGVTYMLILLKVFIYFIDAYTPGDADFTAPDGTKPYIAAHIANLHTAFNIINMIIFLPFIHYLAKLCEWIIKPEDRRRRIRLLKLDSGMANNPSIGIVQARGELRDVSKIPVEMLEILYSSFVKKKSKLKEIKELETKLNQCNHEFTNFMTRLAQEDISENSAHTITEMNHIMFNLEKMGNYIQNIAKYKKRVLKKGYSLTAEAEKEICEMLESVQSFVKNTIGFFNSPSDISELSTAEEDIIDAMRKKFTNNHMRRLQKGKITADSGIVFVDIINHLEKIADHAYLIAQVILTSKGGKLNKV